MYTKKTNELRINLAGIVISIAFPVNSPKDIRPSFPYRCFVTEKNPDVFLKVNYGFLPKHKINEKVFGPTDSWSLYRSQDKYILKASSRQMVLDSDFKSGDIYIKEKKIKRGLHLL